MRSCSPLRPAISKPHRLPSPAPDRRESRYPRAVSSDADPPITPLASPGETLGSDAPVLLSGGSFDPPHRAHIDLALAARDRVTPGGWLVFVPAARSPHKKDNPIAPGDDRVAMLRAATQGFSGVLIWTDELDRAARDSARAGRPAPPSYWVQTLRRARRALGGSRDLRFLIGDDQAASFHKWHDARGILRLAEPVVLLRVGDEAALRVSLEASGFWTPDEVSAWLGRVVPGERIDLSATEVRRLLRTGENERRLAEALHPDVLAYIREHGLYTGTPTG